MLAQRSPKWICRICLNIQTRSNQSRRLTQISGPLTNPAENNVSQISPDEKELPIRRVPLRELLDAKRKAEEMPTPEPLEKSMKKGHDQEQAQDNENEVARDSKSDTQKVGERSVHQGAQKRHTAQTPKIYLRPKQFSMKFLPNTAAKSAQTQAKETTSQASTEPSSEPTQTHSSTSDTAETLPQSEKHVTEPVQSRRSKNLEPSRDPLPSAPTTRLRRLFPVKRKTTSFQKSKPPKVEPEAYTVSHIIAERKIHPADPTNAYPEFPGTAVREVVHENVESGEVNKQERLSSEDIIMTPVQPKEYRPVPTLEHGLDRVLFNPGVMYLRDPRSLVYNFDPYIEKIMPMDEFDYDALYEYITSSRDTTLVDMATQCGASYVGSTSSMTAVLSHYHFLISSWRPVNIDMLSAQYAAQFRSFTAITRAPAGIFLRYKGDGVYAIDADKMYDTNETVLSWLGRSMEKMLTLPPEQMEKFRKDASHTLEPHERGQPEAYHYTKSGTILMRSQLDCNDARLPGTGVFDLKTRACIAVRMDVQRSDEGADYEIHHRTGVYNSFEREYYDMIRSAFLKYSLQVRIGNMDGIFVAYHNTKRIFGFQYISLDEMDYALHGSGKEEIGKREFHFSVKLLNETLDRVVRRFPKQSLRLTFETRDTKVPQMYLFAEPYEEDEIDAIQTGEYIQALRLAEARAKERKEKEKEKDQKPDTESASTISEASNESKTISSSEEEKETTEYSTTENEEKDEDPHLEITQFPVRDLLAMVLKTQNYVCGKQVVGPPSPSAEDPWEITYTFETYPPDRALRLYKMCQERRRKALDEEFREQILEGSETAQKAKEWNQGFLKHLKDLSARGKKWREEFDRTTASREEVIWKGGIPPSKFKSVAWREQQDKSADKGEAN